MVNPPIRPISESQIPRPALEPKKRRRKKLATITNVDTSKRRPIEKYNCLPDGVSMEVLSSEDRDGVHGLHRAIENNLPIPRDLLMVAWWPCGMYGRVLPMYGPLLVFVALTTPHYLEIVVGQICEIDTEPEEVDNLLRLSEVLSELLLLKEYGLVAEVFRAVVMSVLRVYAHNPQPVVHFLATRYLRDIFPTIQAAWKSTPSEIENLLQEIEKIPMPSDIEFFLTPTWNQNGPAMDPKEKMCNYLKTCEQVNFSNERLEKEKQAQLRALRKKQLEDAKNILDGCNPVNRDVDHE